MAAGVIEAIGVISGVLGIVDFLGSSFAAPEPEGARIQIKAGLECTDGCDQFGGSINKVVGFDANNNEVGSADGGKVSQGGVLELTLDQDTPGIQVDYVSVSNSNDATCISWISVRNFDGIEAAAGAWNGDIGQQCGQSWFAGNQIAGSFKEGGDWRPACSWLDGDGTNGIPSASMKFNINAYGDIGSAPTLEQGRQCSSTIYSASGDTITDRPAKRELANEVYNQRRSMVDVPRKDWMNGELVVSQSVPNHNATFMCNHPMSFGPDFIGSDGYFCDMATHTLTPLCSTEQVEGCLEIDPAAKAIKKRSSVARRQVHTTHREYNVISNWS